MYKLLLVSLFLVSCNNKSEPVIKPEQQFFSPTEIDSAIRKLEAVEWAKATETKDSQWLRLHLADELVMTTGRTGDVTNKQQVIAEIMDTAYGSGGSDKIEELKITSFKNTAVATFKIVTNGKDKTGAYFRKARYTEVWIFRDARWQLLSSHSSLLPQ
jgi:ketosteroid isomerase-like protein